MAGRASSFDTKEDVPDLKHMIQGLNKISNLSPDSILRITENPTFVQSLKHALATIEAVELLNIEDSNPLNQSDVKISKRIIENTVDGPDTSKTRWRPAKVPRDEVERLKTLHDLNILDTEREDIFDNILWLATTICETNMGAVSLVDTERQYFKSQKGLNTKQTGRDEAFCSHAILQPDSLFVVEDTAEDSRFADNPLVSGGPKIKFYAGMPLNVGESSLGTLCVIHDRKKKLSRKQKIALRNLGKLCQQQLILRMTNIHLKGMVSKLKKSKSQLKIMNEQILTAAQQKEQFLANMTHELRTPLNAVIGYVTILQENETIKKMPEDILESIESIAFGSKVLRRTVNEVLDFTKINSGKLQLDISEISIHRIILSVAALQTGVAKRKNVIFEKSVDKTLHPGMKVDSMKVIQILNNLVSNAIKFTPEKKKVVMSLRRISSEQELKFPSEIVLKGSPKFATGSPDMKYHYLIMNVRDEGCGIDPKKIETIFQSFQQENVSIARTHGGTGLGLAIVKGITELMNGRIYIESKRHAGSSFCVVIPYKSCRITVKKKEVQNEKLNAPCNARFVLAEDDLLSQKLMRRYFKKMGVNVTICDNGRILCDTVKKILDEKVSTPIIFTDLGMPVMGGLEALKELRSFPSEQPLNIIALTASPEQLYRTNSGFDCILGKPVDFGELRKKLSGICDKLNREGR